MSVPDAWPLTALIEDSDFLHNEAYAVLHDGFDWNPFVSHEPFSLRGPCTSADFRYSQLGPTRRVGASVVTHKGCRYDGGHDEGVYAAMALSWLCVSGASPEEPDALWTHTVTQTTWVNHGSFIAPGPTNVVWPNGGGKQLRLDVNFEDSSVVDSVGKNPRGSRTDSCYHFFQTNT